MEVTASGFLTQTCYFVRLAWGELGLGWRRTQSWGAEVSGFGGVSAPRSPGAAGPSPIAPPPTPPGPIV